MKNDWKTEQAFVNPLCELMIKHGFSTGHGDHFNDVLAELDEQLSARAALRQQDTINRKEAANLIAKRLPIDMLKPYDTDCFSSMLSAVAYLKQQRQTGVVVSREDAEYAEGERSHD